MTLCAHVFKRGKNTGQPCGVANCKKHRMTDGDKATQDSQTSMTDLPADVLNIMLQNVGSHITRCNMKKTDSAIKSLTYLSVTCRYMYAVVDDIVWEAAWNAYVETLEDKPERMESVSAKHNLMLHVLIGCQFCKAPRIRKIYCPFAVRCCTDCLYARTISGWRLQTEYSVPEKLYSRLPHTTVDMYSRRNGYYKVLFYWTKSVEERLGTSLEAHLERHKKQQDILKETIRKRNDEKLRSAIETLPYDYAFVVKNTNYVEINEQDPHKICISGIVNAATSKHNVATNDAFIKNNMKGVHKNLTLTDIRQTPTYKKVKEKTMVVSTDVLWQDFIKDIVNNRKTEFEKAVLNDAVDKHRFKREQLTHIAKCDIVRKKLADIGMERSTNDITNDEWELIREEFPPRGKPTDNDIKIKKNCDVCGTSRLFCEQGLQDHFRDKHPDIADYV